MKRIFVITMLLVSTLILFTSCNKKNKEVPTLNVTETSIEMNVDDTHKIAFTKEYIDTVNFNVSDSAIISVDNAGNVKALAEGSATVTISALEFSFTVNVKVVENRQAKISFVANVNGVSINQASVKYGEDYTLPAAPEVANYEFLGYGMSENATSYVTSLAKVKKDTTIYAIYQIKQYNLTYMLDGGSYSETSGKVNSGSVITLGTPTKDGYDFLGWGLTANATSYVTEVTVTKNTSVYAIFKIKQFTVTLVLDGGSYKESSAKVNYNASYSLGTPTKNGYDFLGWSLTKGSTSYVTSLTVTADVTVYANYEEHIVKYNVKYVLNGATCADAVNGQVLENAKIDLSKLVPSKDHYEFLGWTKEEHSTVYVTGEQTITSDVTFYAQMQIESFDITYNLDGGTLYSSVKTADYNSTITLPTPVKAGFDFLGWSLAKGSTEYITKLENIAADKEVFANWKSKTFSIAYNLDGGSLESKKETINADETYVLPTPSKADYTFLGWTTSKYSSTYITELKNVSANTTLYAHYTQGIVATPETIETVLAAASNGDTITLLAGTYGAITIDKSVIIEGPNAGINPNTEKRGVEAAFNALVEVTADNVTFDGIALTGAGQIYVHGSKNTTILNMYSYDAMLNTDSSKGTGYEAPILAVGSENLTIRFARYDKTTVSGNRNLILYGFNINGLTVEYCSFTGAKTNYNDGMKIANSNDNAAVIKDAYSYGIKGNVTIAHNSFTGYMQYPIWFKNFLEGSYNIIDNYCEACGDCGDANNRGLATFNTYAGSATGDLSVDFSFNTIKFSGCGLRYDASYGTVNVSYNLFYTCSSSYDINFKSNISADVSFNYFETSGKVNNASATDSYATAEEVPTYGQLNSETYNVAYNLDGGSWPASYYTALEIGNEFIKDFNTVNSRSITVSQLDTATIESSWFAAMMTNNTYKTKWMWLLQAIYAAAGKGASNLNPTSADFTASAVKGFYLCNLYGFFNSCQHKESNFGNESIDFSDVYVGKPIIEASEPKGVDEGAATYSTGVVTTLTVPSKAGFAFVGWMTQDGQVINAIPTYMSGDLTLTALWEEEVIAERIEITNIPSDGIKLYSTLQLEWNIVPSNAYNKNVTFFSMDGSIFTVTEDGMIKACGVGTGKLRIKLESNPDYVEYVDIVVWSGEYFDVSYETNSYVGIGDDIQLNASYIDNHAKVQKVTWESLNPEIAVVDNGVVSGVKDGLATIRVAVENDPSLTFDFYVTVLPAELSSAMEFVIENHYSNAFTRYNLGIGAGTPAYYYDVVWSVNKLLLNDPLKIDRRYYDKLAVNVKNNGYMTDVEFVTVHYTGNMNATADADNNCDYFNNLSYAASIHYVTGRTNLTDLTGLSSGYSQDAYYAFAGLNEAYKGWHASDSGLGETKWTATGVKVSATDPAKPVFGVSANSKYTINGKETSITIPSRSDGIKVTGDTFKIGDNTYKSINDLGLAYKIVDGEYYMGNTWWGTQQSGYTLCSIGGNHNSVGIEACVDKGSDLVHTWHVTAQLVADIITRYDLDISRVVGHHFFSGKNCPQPLLENNLEIWKMFIEMVEAEQQLLTTYKNATIVSTAINADGILRNNGLLVQDANAHCVTYEVQVTVEGVTQTITLATCVESYFSCTCQRSQPSLQIEGYAVI